MLLSPLMSDGAFPLMLSAQLASDILDIAQF